jgi:hypothetical protein
VGREHRTVLGIDQHPGGSGGLGSGALGRGPGGSGERSRGNRQAEG